LRACGEAVPVSRQSDKLGTIVLLLHKRWKVDLQMGNASGHPAPITRAGLREARHTANEHRNEQRAASLACDLNVPAHTGGTLFRSLMPSDSPMPSDATVGHLSDLEGARLPRSSPGEEDMLQSDAVLHRGEIDTSIGLALSCLRGHFRTVPAETENLAAAGWYHYLDDQTPGITASAVGLYCFSLADAEFERTEQVLDYLVSRQVKTSTGGGWAVRSTQDFPIVEATAWVVRCLGLPQARNKATREALDSGIEWLEANQNTDYGWGSYKGRPSRTFTTALSVLALREGGGSRSVIGDAHKWLIEAQSPSQPAWGPLSGSEPTMLHTSVALLALLTLPGTLPANAVHQSTEWLLERLQPGQHVERDTAVEEYDVPYSHNKSSYTFQNSLPHFATPLALTALLRAGADPFQKKIFDTVSEIMGAQEIQDPALSGAWELPRSPRRPSIWAIWPFVAALSSARAAIIPSSEGTATLLFPGCSLIQSASTTKHLTRRLLIRNALTDWLRLRKFAVALWAVAGLTVVIPLVLWRTGQFTLDVFLIALALPVLLLLFQILWDRRSSSGGLPR
jgi:hypothetical protein